jgi:hypothetical protein
VAKRKYKRDSSGRFAGGGGGGSTASRGASAKPKAAVAGSKKATPRKSVPKSTKRQKAIKFIAKHPRAVIATAYGATVAVNVARNQDFRNSVTAAVAIKKARQFAQQVASDKKGIGANRPGQGLKAARKSRGAYKIRSS